MRHLPRLRAFIRLRCGPAIRARESASDLAQSVCREVIEDLDRFDYQGEPAFLGWLFAKALSKVRDRNRYHRAQKRDHGREVSIADQYATIVTPSRVAGGHEEVQRMEGAFDELPEEYREVIVLRKLADLSYEEVGARLGKSAAAARALCDRAMKRLTWILSS